MRTILAVALCCGLGGCATFGGGGPDPYGIYDVVTVNGQTLPYQGFSEVSFELRTDDVILVTIKVLGQAGSDTSQGTFTLGEPEDGCVPFESTPLPAPVTGSICGSEMNAEMVGFWQAALKKRR